MELSGTLQRQFFGGPVWVLKSEDGGQYQLQGAIPDALDGERVVVKARKATEAFSFSMVGEILNVQQIRKA